MRRQCHLTTSWSGFGWIKCNACFRRSLRSRRCAGVQKVGSSPLSLGVRLHLSRAEAFSPAGQAEVVDRNDACDHGRPSPGSSSDLSGLDTSTAVAFRTSLVSFRRFVGHRVLLWRLLVDSPFWWKVYRLAFSSMARSDVVRLQCNLTTSWSGLGWIKCNACAGYSLRS